MKTYVKGVVHDTNGKPLDGEIVLVFRGGDTERTKTVGKQGAYSISGLDSDMDYKVSVVHNGKTLTTFSLSLVKKEEQEHNITVDIRGGTSMSTTTTTTTGTTSTGTSTTGTSTTGTSTTGTSTTETTSTGTTTVLAGSTVTGTSPGTGSLSRLLDAVKGIDLHPPVNVEEAEEFRRLYVVSNYITAGLSDAIAALNASLTSESGTGPTMVNKAGLLAARGQTIDDILDLMAEDHNNKQMLMREARAQFDLGSESAESVNVEFKELFREFIGRCSDELMTFDIEDERIKNNLLMTPDRMEEGNNFLKGTKKALISVMESMSRSGRLGTDRLIKKWADIAADSVTVIKTVGSNHIATDDNDQKHEWSVVAGLTDRSRSEIEPYLVHAKEGAENLDTVIKAYNKIRAVDSLAREDKDYLRQLFHDKSHLSFPDPDNPGVQLSLSERLRKDASLVQENWIREWA